MANESPLTLSQTIGQMRSALQDYIEAAYHIGDPDLIVQRRELLEREGVIYRAPFIESTPDYQNGLPFAELDLPPAALELLGAMAEPGEGEPLLHDPPYAHQAKALIAAVRESKSLVVMTGTGSGKTESFLMPILAKLAIEAQTKPDSFANSSVRALLLYPMNALVNDQLARLRLMFGSPTVADLFTLWAGRPARFARYTSRTPYPGVRTRTKDDQHLKEIKDFYLKHFESDQEHPLPLVENLKARGKWPAKPDLGSWYGSHGGRWKSREGEWIRAVTQPGDRELLTRHEVLANPPDVLVTNYSMLEYMLMRPLERPVFDKTRQWLSDNSDENLLVVLDEAHLYRGASGAQVGLLLRRFRDRLGIKADRLQVICTSASFKDSEGACKFAAELSGKESSDFVPITGDLALRSNEGPGTDLDTTALAKVDLSAYYEADKETDRLRAVKPLLDYRKVDSQDLSSSQALYEALHEYAPLGLLINETMREAFSLDELATTIFPGCADGDLALTNLVALGSIARSERSDRGLLPCRVHAFYRGLPGLWACMDRDCRGVDQQHHGGPTGMLYSQPRTWCEACHARVFELFTCRNCGTAYARAYTDKVEQPEFLWSEPGTGFQSVGGPVAQLEPLDLLLESPTDSTAELVELDLVTGRLNPRVLGERNRQVFMRGDRIKPVDPDDEETTSDGLNGAFNPCGVCKGRGGYGGWTVQNHQTKGDEPFQALVTKQLEVQPAVQDYSSFAPLRGRKVLAFSDSRQVAAKLAPNIQTYSTKDVLRPLILSGWKELSQDPSICLMLTLEHVYLAALIGAKRHGVRLRPSLSGSESMNAAREVNRVIGDGDSIDTDQLLPLISGVGPDQPPQSLLRGLVDVVIDNYYGLPSLALASVRERSGLTDQLKELPAIPGLASDDDTKLALARLWLAHWPAETGIWFRGMTSDWWMKRRGVRAHKGNFEGVQQWLSDKESQQSFNRDWLPLLMELFCETTGPGQRILARNLCLDIEPGWAYCQVCRTTQRPFPGMSRCISCAKDAVVEVDPDSDTVFSTRKGYYRKSAMKALAGDSEPLMAIIAAEHTAQLNAAETGAVFSKAEEHELLFQDIDLGPPSPGAQPRAAIDVLSCTTTMEVGIDIGTLSGVALRNMPPSRASYQQRAGRAGRRGRAVATVIAFGSADTHDNHYFTNPGAMITGNVSDPVLAMDNPDIARRHLTAFLFQEYHQDRLPAGDHDESQPQLFEVLGTVTEFLDKESRLNRTDFETWLRDKEEILARRADDWLPLQLSYGDRTEILNGIVDRTLELVDDAVGDHDPEVDANSRVDDSLELPAYEAQQETGTEEAVDLRNLEKLLDRLFYKGVLPRYAFPTDVVAMHVFNKEQSYYSWPVYDYSPTQGLPIALTQYAPGKELWIDGKCWTSGAIYSPMKEGLAQAWDQRKLYFECNVCHFAITESTDTASHGELRDCPACGSAGEFGEAHKWIRPPGFAHRFHDEEGTSPDDQLERSYATRAKLVPDHTSPEQWEEITQRIWQHFDRRGLLMSNTGPLSEGYNYCAICGVIEPTALPKSAALLPGHLKPYPDRDSECPGSLTTKGLVLGTEFVSDVLLISLSVEKPLELRPGYLATETVLRTLCEAITIAAAHKLEVDSSELQAEFRPAPSQAGAAAGSKAEIYMYDTPAGGAGFSRKVATYGLEVFEETLRLLEECPGDCERSCYRCLRSFKNRFEHSLLDRHLGASLLRYALYESEPVLKGSRVENAIGVLFEDLQRLNLQGCELTRDDPVLIAGIGKVMAPIRVVTATKDKEAIIGVHGPLTPDHSYDVQLDTAKDYSTSTCVVLVDEIVISQNLPWATKQVCDRLNLS